LPGSYWARNNRAMPSALPRTPKETYGAAD
jgi:hypothetical protein